MAQFPEFTHIILNDILRNGVFKLFTKYFIHFIAVQYIPLIFQLIKNEISELCSYDKGSLCKAN